jgi:hypothetical protein
MSDDPGVELLKTPKKRVNGKRKGNNFEGSICKTLGETLSPLKFRRSQSSGAILGGKNERFMQHYSDAARSLFVGDVVPTNESDVERDLGWKLKFTLECKFYKIPDNIEHLLYQTRIRGWFEQALTDSVKISKEPLLIFKFNHTEIFCAVNFETIDRLPTGITKIMNLTFLDSNPTPRSMAIFHLKEALVDVEWWKTYKQPESHA